MSDNYDTLSDRELDALVAENVTDIGICRCPHRSRYPLISGRCANCDIPATAQYCTDDNAARRIRDRIAELGLKIEFTNQVFGLVGRVRDTHNCNISGSAIEGFAWDAMQATPRQQMIAALRSLGGTDGR